MIEPSRDPSSILDELKRRKVIRAMVLYAAVGLAVLEGSGIILEAFLVPAAVYRVIVALVIIGFPVAIVLAWAFEMTPKGLKHELPSEDVRQIPVTPVRSRMQAVTLPTALAVIALLVWRPWSGVDPLAALAADGFTDSVAVLPIADHTADEDLSHVAAGIMDEIVGRLMGVRGVKVSDPFSVRQLVLKGLTGRELADSLEVEKLVTPSVYHDQAGLRLNVRTTEGATGRVLWQGQYAASSSDYGAAVGLARAFSQEYVDHTPQLSFSEIVANEGHRAGHEAYLFAKGWLPRRTREAMRQAQEGFSEAIDTDSSYAAAYAGLSKVYALSLTYRYRTELGGYEAAAQAWKLATRAIELAPDQPDGYQARGYIASRSWAPPEVVAPDCLEAIRLAPGAADALSWCSRVLNQRGLTVMAERIANRAIEVDPENPGRRVSAAYDALSLGEFDRALSESRAAKRLAPALMLPRALEARALLLSGRAAECAGLDDLGPHDGIRATCMYALGQVREADAIADSIAAAVQTRSLEDPVYADVVRAEDLAGYFAFRGEPEATLAWIALAYSFSPSGIEPRILESALFARVNETEAFRDSVEAIRAGVWARVVETADRLE